MNKLEASLFENIDFDTGEVTYELWLHDYGSLSSQLIDVAWTFEMKRQLNVYAEKINNLLVQGGY